MPTNQMTETPSLQERALHARAMLTRQSGLADAMVGGGALESAVAATPDANEILARVDDVLRSMPADEIGDPDAFKAALRTLLEHGDPALRKLVDPVVPETELSGDEVGSLEAIVVADGSRPSFLLRSGGTFDQNHPFLGDWRNDMIEFAPTLRTLAGNVGRVQPTQGNSSMYIGTGVLVDHAKGLVLTNFHVIDEARKSFGITMETQPDGRTLRVIGDLAIDFDGESGTTGRNRFRVAEIRLPQGFGRGFGGLDAAVMRIEPLDQGEGRLPEGPIMLSADPDYANGAAQTLVTIGFPGKPDQVDPPGATVDWNFVVKTLFGNRFGVKRVAPGRFMNGPGSLAADGLGRVLTHDATTFGGASGSLVFAWKDAHTPAFALHFSGATLSTNNAVSLQRAADALREVGVPLA